ncbi:glutaminase family protein [Anaerocolumna chitinilytica]|uniref:DUF4965 domain-containing protein n=1 Tax=Anaerocolumna chitinilytica TaxID=1727145 RepID=A0A7M3SB82_9FIRM|nr:glutaminase family protein [Anaerocolumna chitinilytica]BCK01850.1 hypothetical protein bsdcttw_48900 [Anaerocolumna chitinilytica]
MNTQFRAPAIPLVTVDPYFNVWSMSDRLNGDYTRHWTGAKNSMTGIVLVDGNPYIFAGKLSPSAGKPDYPDCPAMSQTKLEIKPLSTIYTFTDGGIELTASFITPLLMDDLDLLARPASYISFSAASVDGKAHQVRIYFDITAEWCINNTKQEVSLGHNDFHDISCVYAQNAEQKVLNRVGDDLRIDWGSVNLAVAKAAGSVVCTGNADLRKTFITEGTIAEGEVLKDAVSVSNTWPVLASMLDLGSITPEREASSYLVLAYNDIYSVEYFHEKLTGYWTRSFSSFNEMLECSVLSFQEVLKKCDTFNNTLKTDAIAAGGEKYYELLSLAYRQAIAAHKLVADPDGNVLFLSKENFSNGCMATVDVSYPSIPLFLLYNTELVKGMMRPIFKYAASEAWPFEFAPHDVGCYPKANGQVYGLEDGKLLHKYQMPVEECGNMLIMAATVSVQDGNADFASKNWELLCKWADYLKENGLDPENQLCTDDFAGHLAHNANLSIKAIVALAAFSRMSEMLGKTDLAAEYLGIAREMAAEWESKSAEEDHYKLTFGTAGTWSMKYNMVWDEILGLNVFSKEIPVKEAAYYLTQMNQYGLPLDSRNTYTKSDWMVWVATLCNSKELFDTIIDSLWRSLSETNSRVPFTDWYDTVTGRQIGFQNRSVLGGIFIKLLRDSLTK